MASNFKAAAVAIQEDRTETLRVKIAGLTPDYSEEGVYEITGIVHRDVQWEKIHEVLEAAGIAPADSTRYIDELAERIFQMELAKTLVGRMKVM